MRPGVPLNAVYYSSGSHSDHILYINHVQHINQPFVQCHRDSNCMKTWKKNDNTVHEYKEIKPALHNGNKADGSGSYGKLISRFSALLAYYHFNPISE